MTDNEPSNAESPRKTTYETDISSGIDRAIDRAISRREGCRWPGIPATPKVMSEFVEKVNQHPEIMKVSIQFRSLEPEAAQQLVDLQHVNNINLSHSVIPTEQLVKIASKPGLKELNLDGMKDIGEAVVAFAEAGNEKRRLLNDWVDLGDKAIAALARHPEVTAILHYLPQCELTNATNSSSPDAATSHTRDNLTGAPDTLLEEGSQNIIGPDEESSKTKL